jgi:translation initiation factor IF-2
MADVTVAQFAEVLKVPVEKLLVQLERGRHQGRRCRDIISDEAKMELLTHLRRSHGRGEDAAPAPAQDHAAAQAAERDQARQHAGRARTVNVEVREEAPT